MTEKQWWSFYDLESGLFTGRCYSGRRLAANTPEGCGAVAGQIDHLAMRVYLATGELIEFVPAPPSADHEWNALSKRWQLGVEAQERVDADVRARALLDEIDRKQARRVREILAASDPQLAELEAQAAALRPQIIKREVRNG